MATKKNQSATSSNGRNVGRPGWSSNITFINVSLSDAQKSVYDGWIRSNPDILSIADGIVASGYKLSFGFDEKNAAFMATITDRKEGSPFNGSCFTLRGRELWQAFSRVLWVHAIYCEGDWHEIASPNQDSDIW